MAGRPQTLTEGQKKEVTRLLWKQILTASLVSLALLGGITGLSLWGIKCRLERNLEVLVAEQFKEPQIRTVVSNVAATNAKSLLIEQIMPKVARFQADIATQVASTKKLVASTQGQLKELSSLIEISSQNAKEEMISLNEQVQKQQKIEKKLAAILSDAQEALASMHILSKFTLTVNLAQLDDRAAYNQLKAWAKDTKFPFQTSAKQTYRIIRKDFYGARGYEKSFELMTWNEGANPEEFDIEEARHIFWNECPAIKAREYVQFVWTHKNLTKEEKLSFMYDVLSDSRNSLHAADAAARLLAKEANIKYNPVLEFDEIKKWWEKKMANSKTKVDEANES